MWRNGMQQDLVNNWPCSLSAHTSPTQPPVSLESGDAAGLWVRRTGFGRHSHNYCLATSDWWNLGPAPDVSVASLSFAATVQMVCGLLAVLCQWAEGRLSNQSCQLLWKAVTRKARQESCCCEKFHNIFCTANITIVWIRRNSFEASDWNNH